MEHTDNTHTGAHCAIVAHGDPDPQLSPRGFFGADEFRSPVHDTHTPYGGQLCAENVKHTLLQTHIGPLGDATTHTRACDTTKSPVGDGAMRP